MPKDIGGDGEARMRRISSALLEEIRRFIDERLVDGEPIEKVPLYFDPPKMMMSMIESVETVSARLSMPSAMPAVDASLAEAVSSMDESFRDMLLREIDERNMTDPECYKRANLDRKHFSKIRSNRGYSPKKRTVLALAIALKLDLDETKDFLLKAGYGLSRSSRSDIIVEYFITRKNYDIEAVNEALFAFNEKTLGG